MLFEKIPGSNLQDTRIWLKIEVPSINLARFNDIYFILV